jgi:hypothetical protein
VYASSKYHYEYK